MLFKLCAKLRSTSKYYEQGLDQQGQPQLMQVTQIEKDLNGYHFWCLGPLVSDCYRREDLEFYAYGKGGIKLVQLS